MVSLNVPLLIPRLDMQDGKEKGKTHLYIRTEPRPVDLKTVDCLNEDAQELITEQTKTN